MRKSVKDTAKQVTTLQSATLKRLVPVRSRRPAKTRENAEATSSAIQSATNNGSRRPMAIRIFSLTEGSRRALANAQIATGARWPGSLECGVRPFDREHCRVVQ